MSGPGSATARMPYRRCARQWTIFSGQANSCTAYGHAVLVDALLESGAEADLAEAEAAVDRVAAIPGDDGWVARDVWLLRLRALLARAHGDKTAYRDYRDRYRVMATKLGFEGHMAWAEAMP